MKKFIALSFIIIFVFSGCSNDAYSWKFSYEYNYVQEIKIIEVHDEFNYSVVKAIDLELIDELYADISNLKMKRYGANLSSPSGLCFLILFKSGEYDIISQKESKHYKFDEDKLRAYNSWLCCDDVQFKELVEKYLYL